MVEFYWTINVVISLIAVLFILFSVIITFKYYIHNHYKHLLYYAIMWSFWLIWQLFQAISDLFLSKNLHIICFYALIGTGFFTILFVDTISRNSYDLWKILIFSFISCAVIIFSFEEDAVIISSEGITPYPTMNGRFRLASLFLMIYILFLLIFFNFKIYLNTPKHLLYYSRLNLIGVLLYGVVPYIIQFTYLEHLIPGIANSSIALGSIIATNAMIKQPQLAFILPFKIDRIIIVDTESGMPLFTHMFSQSNSEFSESVFSGVIKAIGTLFDFTLNKGKVEQIVLEQAVLMLQSCEDLPLVSILIADKATPSLSKSLSAFSKKLYSDPRINVKYKKTFCLEDFDFIRNYVQDYFSFLP